MPARRDANRAIADIPLSPQDTSHGSMSRPSVWVARLKGRWHYYGKNCCLAWQPPEFANLTGIISEYHWEEMHGNLNARIPVVRPTREFDNGGCWVETTDVNYSEGTVPIIGDVFDPSGFAALNMAEFTYTADGEEGGPDPLRGLRRIDGDNAGYSHNGDAPRTHGYVIMSFGMFKDRLMGVCPNETRKDRLVPFFHRYFFLQLETCQ